MIDFKDQFINEYDLFINFKNVNTLINTFRHLIGKLKLKY